MLDNRKTAWLTGGACGLLGSAAWWLLSAHDPSHFAIVAASTAIGGLFTGRFIWYLILTRPGKLTVLRGIIAGGVTGFVFHIPSAIISGILTLLFQFSLPLDKRLVLAGVYLIGGFTAPVYFAPMIFVGGMALIGGVISFLQLRKEAQRPLS